MYELQENLVNEVYNYFKQKYQTTISDNRINIKYNNYPDNILSITISVYSKSESSLYLNLYKHPDSYIIKNDINSLNLDEVENIIESLNKQLKLYMDFLHNIVKYIDEEEYNFIEYLIDLNQLRMYIKNDAKNKIIVITPEFVLDKNPIKVAAYINQINSNYPSKIFVNSANIEDVFESILFFL